MLGDETLASWYLFMFRTPQHRTCKNNPCFIKMYLSAGTDLSCFLAQFMRKRHHVRVPNGCFCISDLSHQEPFSKYQRQDDHIGRERNRSQQTSPSRTMFFESLCMLAITRVLTRCLRFKILMQED